MVRVLTIIISSFISLNCFAQTKMLPLDDLINMTDPGWTLVKQWIDSAKNKIEVLPVDTNKAKDALYKTQVTTRSPMGAIVYMTGGLLIDDGWIRILGSGNSRLCRTLPEWNKGKAYKDYGEPPSFLLIADDVLGGYYILNGGYFGSDKGKVYYFSPDNLEYEPLDLSYTEFLLFCFNNSLDEFYKGYRWQNWRQDLARMGSDMVFNFFPCLWTKEGKDIERVSRKAIPADEQYDLNLYLRKQLGLD